MDALKDECGIIAVYQMGKRHEERNVTPIVVRGLMDLQNRGQLSAGLTSYNPTRNRILQTHKGVGTVQEVFHLGNPTQGSRLMEEYAGGAAIGHTRYATSGASDIALAQPFERVHGRMWKWFAIGFNGNLANYHQLSEQLEESGYHITYHSDTEVMMHYINRELRGEEPPEFGTVFGNLSSLFDGAYNIVFLNAVGEMVVMRDPLGIKPLCYGIKDELLVVASESNVLLHLDMEPVTVAPGEMIVASREGWRKERFFPEQKPAHCFFEWTYFANLASNLDGRAVYQARQAMGKELADQEIAAQRTPLDTTDRIVVPIPETAYTVGQAYAFHLGLPVQAGLLRNRYVGRTFIDGLNRADSIRMKFTPLREVLEGKKVHLVDDTLVRATTLKTVIADLRVRGGAREIHVRIGCPPILGPCFYGIDMPTIRELFAPTYMENAPTPELSDKIQAAMAKELGADSLIFLSMEALIRAIGLPHDNLCLACLNNHYPTPTGRLLYQQARLDAGLKPMKP